MAYSPEVLIYIQTIKSYLKHNSEAREYFLNNNNEDDFYKRLTMISQKNFDEAGDEKLSKIQFESLRESISEEEYIERRVEEFFQNKTLFFEVPNFGVFSLN